MSDMPDKIWLWGGGFATDASYTTNPKAVQQEVDTEYTRTDLAQATIEKLSNENQFLNNIRPDGLLVENTKLKATIEKLENPWISVEDRLPGKSGVYLTMTKGDDIVPSEWLLNGFSFGKFAKPYITHWMPIPPQGDRS